MRVFLLLITGTMWLLIFKGVRRWAFKDDYPAPTNAPTEAPKR